MLNIGLDIFFWKKLYFKYRIKILNIILMNLKKEANIRPLIHLH